MIPQQEIDYLAQKLRKGGVIAYPTDTVWGIGCDATNDEAIQQVKTIKKRPDTKGFVVLVDSLERLKNYVDIIPPKAMNLIVYHERPLTIVYDKVKNLSPKLLAPDGSCAIRVTKDLFCQELIATFDGAIVSTSANLSGNPPAKSYAEIDEIIKKSVDAVADYRREEVSETPPSTIVRIDEKSELVFLRK